MLATGESPQSNTVVVGGVLGCGCLVFTIAAVIVGGVIAYRTFFSNMFDPPNDDDDNDGRGRNGMMFEKACDRYMSNVADLYRAAGQKARRGNFDKEFIPNNLVQAHHRAFAEVQEEFRRRAGDGRDPNKVARAYESLASEIKSRRR